MEPGNSFRRLMASAMETTREILKFTVLGVLIGCMVLWAMACDLFAGEAPPANRGRASWYGEGYRGRIMANGQTFNPDALTCACWDWPLGSWLLVEHNDGHSVRTVRVQVTDRGPDRRLGRMIDLSRAAFARLSSTEIGIITVSVHPVK
jgi:rare lipoprotein A (peptidoglycan hydrolase)